jgi:hypothetical protein
MWFIFTKNNIAFVSLHLDGFITSGNARLCSAEVRPLESFDPPPRPLQFLLEESADGRSL